MKTFFGGLALAAGMALLNGIATPSSSLCLVFPEFQSPGLAEVANDDSCIAACARRRTGP